MAKTKVFNLREALGEAYAELVQSLSANFLEIASAAVLLFVGYGVALLLQFLIKRIIGGLDLLLSRSRFAPAVGTSLTRASASVVGKLVFWLVLIFFIFAATKVLGWNFFSTWISALLSYLPNIITGSMIIVLGLLLSSIARTAAIKAALTAGYRHADFLGSIAQIAVIVAASVIGIEQLGINIAFLTTSFVVAMGVFLFGVALAFGLGAKSLMANIIAAQVCRKHIQIGDYVSNGACEGFLIDISQTSIVLDSEEGKITVPAQSFLDSTWKVLSLDREQDSAAASEESHS